MVLTIVGSGTVVPDRDRVCSSYLVEETDARVLFDCGPGTVHHLARFGLQWSRLTHIVISHFHTDHIGDLPMLLFSLKHGLRPERNLPLEVIGPPGLGSLMARLADAFGPYVLDPGFPLQVVEASGPGALPLPDSSLPGSTSLQRDPGLRLPEGRALAPHAILRCAPTPHTDHSLAWRFEGSACFGYTGDTGYSDALAGFLAGCDLVIAECSLPDDEAIDTHLTPSRLARLAIRANPKTLLVTHVYPQLARRDVPGLIRAAGWEGELVVAQDGARLRLAG